MELGTPSTGNYSDIHFWGRGRGGRGYERMRDGIITRAAAFDTSSKSFFV
jgi:hypothetical protein